MKNQVRIVNCFLLTALTFLVYVWLAEKPNQNILRLTQNQSLTTSPQVSENSKKLLVTKVIDGDTIEIYGGVRVRYIGIDTPETVDPRKPVECFGKKSSDENKRLVYQKMVRLEKDVSETDKYGRLLRYVYVNGVMINDYLVRNGYAYASSYPPDIKYQDEFVDAQKEAQKFNRGIWSGCTRNSTGPSGILKIEPMGSGEQRACIIKGNISSGGEKIFHNPACETYDKTVIDESKGERWFCSEGEAESAGWRRAQNCP